jgi:hypothetical protein
MNLKLKKNAKMKMNVGTDMGTDTVMDTVIDSNMDMDTNMDMDMFCFVLLSFFRFDSLYLYFVSHLKSAFSLQSKIRGKSLSCLLSKQK